MTAERPEPTHIVLAVVRHGDRICVAQRSQRVATSRGLWSVVTGYLEPGVEPQDQAWSELSEELGLPRSVLVLRRRLPGVPLTSPGSGKAFVVHPFLFDSTSREVVLNWENDAVQWVDPDWLDQAWCVPWQAALVRALLADGGQDAAPPQSAGPLGLAPA
jgi:8-oxo-dGTP pyrophosphatase MutT (NUDIX family)